MASELLPRAQGPFTNADGSPTVEWYDFLRVLAELLDSATSDAARIAILEAAIAALPAVIVQSVRAGSGVIVDSTDPRNPIVSVSGERGLTHPQVMARVAVGF